MNLLTPTFPRLLLFVVLSPFILGAVNSEAGQVVVISLAAFALALLTGYEHSGIQRRSYIRLGASLGLLNWIALMLYTAVRYPNALALWDVWFIRFGLVVALAFVGGLLCGDLLERKRLTLSSPERRPLGSSPRSSRS